MYLYFVRPVIIIITISRVTQKHEGKKDYARNISGESKIIKSRNTYKNNRTTLSEV
jgi:hypothetical protein